MLLRRSRDTGVGIVPPLYVFSQGCVQAKSLLLTKGGIIHTSTSIIRPPTGMTSKSSYIDWPAYCEGVGSWASYSKNNNNNKPWEGKGTLPYTLACTAKSRPGSRRHQMAKREKERERKKKKKEA